MFYGDVYNVLVGRNSIKFDVILLSNQVNKMVKVQSNVELLQYLSYVLTGDGDLSAMMLYASNNYISQYVK